MINLEITAVVTEIIMRCYKLQFEAAVSITSLLVQFRPCEFLLSGFSRIQKVLNATGANKVIEVTLYNSAVNKLRSLTGLNSEAHRQRWLNLNYQIAPNYQKSMQYLG